jgi:hypothetical protein
MSFFNATNTPTPAQRTASLEALIIATLNLFPRNAYDVRKFVLSCDEFEWVTLTMLTNTLYRMSQQKRIEQVFKDGLSVPIYRLPEDPTKGFSRFPTTSEAITERERKILGSMNWPRFFHIPTKEELRPHSKARTGYDPRADYAHV